MVEALQVDPPAVAGELATFLQPEAVFFLPLVPSPLDLGARRPPPWQVMPEEHPPLMGTSKRLAAAEELQWPPDLEGVAAAC